MTCCTSVPTLVFLGLCSRLRPDVRGRQTSDGQISDAHHDRLMPPTLGVGHSKLTRAAHTVSFCGYPRTAYALPSESRSKVEPFVFFLSQRTIIFRPNLFTTFAVTIRTHTYKHGHIHRQSVIAYQLVNVLDVIKSLHCSYTRYL